MKRLTFTPAWDPPAPSASASLGGYVGGHQREHALQMHSAGGAMRTSLLLRVLLSGLGVMLITHAARAQDGDALPNSLGDSQADLVYTPVTPCRIIDTRLAGGAIAAGATRSFKVTGDTTSQGGTNCGIPSGVATSAMVNFVAVGATAPGDLRVTPFGSAMPLASILNWAGGVSGLNLANGLAIALCSDGPTTCTSDITLQADGSSIHIVADVQGYFRRTPALQVNGVLNSTVLGQDALTSNTTGDANSAFGSSALHANTTGRQNSAFGSSALLANSTGSDNAAFGFDALAANTTGQQNSAFGTLALLANTTGSQNSAFGYYALGSNKTGGANVAFGANALASNISGLQNATVGLFGMQANTAGSWNVAIGNQALKLNAIGNSNSAFGFRSLEASTGDANTALGYWALVNLATGSANVAVGNGAGFALTAGSNNVYIENAGASNDSGTIRIGTAGLHTTTYVAGISGATVASGVGVYIGADGQLGTATSSRRYKEAIADIGAGSEVLMKLRPVSFYYRPDLDATHTRQYGLVAEDVAEIAPELVLRDEMGAPQTVRYHFINAMLLNEVQKQRRLVDEQRQLAEEQRRENEEQETTIASQQSKIQDLETRLRKLEAALAGDR